MLMARIEAAPSANMANKYGSKRLRTHSGVQHSAISASSLMAVLYKYTKNASAEDFQVLDFGF